MNLSEIKDRTFKRINNTTLNETDYNSLTKLHWLFTAYTCQVGNTKHCFAIKELQRFLIMTRSKIPLSKNDYLYTVYTALQKADLEIKLTYYLSLQPEKIKKNEPYLFNSY